MNSRAFDTSPINGYIYVMILNALLHALLGKYGVDKNAFKFCGLKYACLENLTRENAPRKIKQLYGGM